MKSSNPQERAEQLLGRLSSGIMGLQPSEQQAIWKELGEISFKAVESREITVDNNGVQLAIDAARSKDSAVAASALLILMNVSTSHEGRGAAYQQGGIDAAVHAFSLHGKDSSTVAHYAVGFLGNQRADNDIYEAGGVAVAQQALKAHPTDGSVVFHSLRLLSNLLTDTDHKARIAKELIDNDFIAAMIRGAEACADERFVLVFLQRVVLNMARLVDEETFCKVVADGADCSDKLVHQHSEHNLEPAFGAMLAFRDAAIQVEQLLTEVTSESSKLDDKDLQSRWTELALIIAERLRSDYVMGTYIDNGGIPAAVAAARSGDPVVVAGALKVLWTFSSGDRWQSVHAEGGVEAAFDAASRHLLESVDIAKAALGLLANTARDFDEGGGQMIFEGGGVKVALAALEAYPSNQTLVQAVLVLLVNLTVPSASNYQRDVAHQFINSDGMAKVRSVMEQLTSNVEKETAVYFASMIENMCEIFYDGYSDSHREKSTLSQELAQTVCIIKTLFDTYPDCQPSIANAMQMLDDWYSRDMIPLTREPFSHWDDRSTAAILEWRDALDRPSILDRLFASEVSEAEEQALVPGSPSLS